VAIIASGIKDWQMQRRKYSSIICAMFEHRRERQKLQRGIAEIDRKSAGRVKNENIELLGYAVAQDRFLRGDLAAELKILEVSRLVGKAQRLGIEIEEELPSNSVYRDGSKVWWDEYTPTQKKWINDKGKSRLEELIKEKQYKRRKKWVDVYVPIISLLISLAALVTSIIAIYRTSR
jgi:hypothetical protein